MKPEETERLINLRDAVDAHLIGEPVEVSQKGINKWGVTTSPNFDFASYDYRPIAQQKSE